MIQLTLTLRVTAQVVETLVTVNNGSSQDFVHPDDHAQPTYKMTSGFNLSQFHKRWSVIEIKKS